MQIIRLGSIGGAFVPGGVQLTFDSTNNVVTGATFEQIIAAAENNKLIISNVGVMLAHVPVPADSIILTGAVRTGASLDSSYDQSFGDSQVTWLAETFVVNADLSFTSTTVAIRADAILHGRTIQLDRENNVVVGATYSQLLETISLGESVMLAGRPLVLQNFDERRITFAVSPVFVQNQLLHGTLVISNDMSFTITENALPLNDIVLSSDTTVMPEQYRQRFYTDDSFEELIDNPALLPVLQFGVYRCTPISSQNSTFVYLCELYATDATEFVQHTLQISATDWSMQLLRETIELSTDTSDTSYITGLSLRTSADNGDLIGATFEVLIDTLTTDLPVFIDGIQVKYHNATETNVDVIAVEPDAFSPLTQLKLSKYTIQNDMTYSKQSVAYDLSSYATTNDIDAAIASAITTVLNTPV